MVKSAQHEPMALAAKVGGVSRTVEVVERAPHEYDVTIDGVAHTVDARMLRRGSLSLLIDHRSHTVEVASDGDRHRVDVGGRTIEVTLVDTLRHGGVAALEDETGPQEIKAMMPGKIVAVLVAAGDAVEAGQGLLVVEAMKMENEVRAAAAGTVTELKVEPGQAVEAGETLVRIE